MRTVRRQLQLRLLRGDFAEFFLGSSLSFVAEPSEGSPAQEGAKR